RGARRGRTGAPGARSRRRQRRRTRRDARRRSCSVRSRRARGQRRRADCRGEAPAAGHLVAAHGGAQRPGSRAGRQISRRATMRKTLAVIGALLCADAAAAVPQLDLSVTMNPLKLEFSAQADLSLEAAEKFDFSLAPGFEIDRIEVDGNSVPVRRLDSAPSPRYEITLSGRL